MNIDIADIKVGKRMRELDKERVTGLANSIKEIGLLNPITVTRYKDKYSLVAGLHRLEAYKLLSKKSIPATVIELDELHSELAQIDENLSRNDLSALDQSLHVARRKEIYEALYPETSKGKAQAIGSNKAQGNNVSDKMSPTFSEDTASKTGQAERSVERQSQIGRELADYADDLRGSSIENNQSELLKLSRMPKEQRGAEAKSLKEGRTKRVGEASRQAERTEIAKSGAKVKSSDKWHIYQGDIKTWKSEKQYDFIITDPPYPKEFLSLYEILAIRANEFLKDGGLLVAMCGQSYLDQIYAMMSKHLTYYWTAAYLTPGQPTPLRQVNVNTTWKPLLIMSKGKYTGRIFGDVFTSDGNDKSMHKWGQSESGMYSIISGLCLEGQSILDPLCGAGTTGVAALRFGCLFDGVELEIENVNISKGRLSE